MTIDEIKLTLPAETRLPKYLALADALGNWIALNHPDSGSRLPSERSLAESCGTTPVTVAKGLNELVRKGVLERRAGSGTYIAVKGGFSGTLRIGIVAHEPIKNDECYISDVLQTLYGYWQSRGADLISLIRTPEHYEQTLREYNLAGLFVVAPQEEFAPKLRELTEKGVPLVTIGICLEGMNNCSFGTEHRKVCERAVEYLHSRGHRRIGLLNSMPWASSCAEREAGYLRGMWNAKLPVNPDWVIRGPFGKDAFDESTLISQLTGQDRLSALLLANHGAILPFYRLANRLSLKIPDDLSIIAFDDPGYAAQLTPSLTVFAQPVKEFSHQAAEQLERLLQHRNLLPVIPSEAVLIERGSCKTITG